MRPGDVTVRSNLALVRAQLGDPQTGVALLQECLETEPQNPTLAFNLALLHRQAADPCRAVECFERVILSEPPGSARAQRAHRELVALRRVQDPSKAQ